MTRETRALLLGVMLVEFVCCKIVLTVFSTLHINMCCDRPASLLVAVLAADRNRLNDPLMYNTELVGSRLNSIKAKDAGS